MRSSTLFLLILSLHSYVFGQTEITLSIQHTQGTEAFELGKTSTNNLNHQYKTDRLEYYISEISLIHDNGTETQIEDLYLLVDASETTSVSLGNFDVTNLEKVKFHVGVDSINNHGDPTLYHGTHPLSPQAPSMHWGWTAGYRFVAYEGYSGTNLNQQFQIHSLGDINYFTTVVDTEVSASNGTLDIILDADYSKALQDIAMNSGLIVHSDNLQARQLLENFRDHVFSNSTLTNTIDQINDQIELEIFPNPTHDFITVKIDTEKIQLEQPILRIVASNGTILHETKYNSEFKTIDFTSVSSGNYILQLISNRDIISSRPVIVH